MSETLKELFERLGKARSWIKDIEAEFDYCWELLRDLEHVFQAQQGTVKFHETDLEALPWVENRRKTGWWIHKHNCLELWNEILKQPNKEYHLGDYVYIIYDTNRPYINRFKKKPQELQK